MAAKYYTNLFEIEDVYRKKKYHALLLASLQNDLSRWKQIINTNVQYISPDYNDEHFVVEIRGLYTAFAYVCHSKTPPITGRPNELISEDFPKDLSNEVAKLRETIYTSDIYEIEKSIGNTRHARKEKLEFIEIEQLKEIIEDTYQDWIKNSSEISAKLVAKLIYAYRKDEDMLKLWSEKFGESELIMDELKKIKG